MTFKVNDWKSYCTNSFYVFINVFRHGDSNHDLIVKYVDSKTPIQNSSKQNIYLNKTVT